MTNTRMRTSDDEAAATDTDDVVGYELSNGEKAVVAAAMTAAAINPVAVAAFAYGAVAGLALSDAFAAGYAAGSNRNGR